MKKTTAFQISVLVCAIATAACIDTDTADDSEEATVEPTTPAPIARKAICVALEPCVSAAP